MKVPCLFLQNVYFPGLVGDLSVSTEQVRALHTFQTLEGFGALEVLLTFANDDTQLPSPDNFFEFGVLATIEGNLEDLLDTTSDTIRLPLGESHRVAITSLQATTSLYGEDWEGCVATFESRKPRVSKHAEDLMERLKHELYTAILLGAERTTTGPRIAFREPLESIAAPMTELDRWKASDATLCYRAAEYTLRDAKDRRAVLALDDPSKALDSFDILRHLPDGATHDLHGAYLEHLEHTAGLGLEQSIAAVSAAATFARLELLSLPAGTSRDLHDVVRDLEKCLRRFNDVLERVEDA